MSICGRLMPLFRTSGDVSSGFQSQSGFCLIRTLWRHWYMFPEIHLWCDTSASVYSQHSSQSPSPHACFSRGGMPGFELPTSCSAVWRATHSATATDFFFIHNLAIKKFGFFTNTKHRQNWHYCQLGISILYSLLYLHHVVLNNVKSVDIKGLHFKVVYIIELIHF